jgi:hypothetical protein
MRYISSFYLFHLCSPRQSCSVGFHSSTSRLFNIYSATDRLFRYRARPYGNLKVVLLDISCLDGRPKRAHYLPLQFNSIETTLPARGHPYTSNPMHISIILVYSTLRSAAREPIEVRGCVNALPRLAIIACANFMIVSFTIGIKGQV